MQCRQLVVQTSAWPRRLSWLTVLLALWFAWSGADWYISTAAPWWLQCGWLPVFYLLAAATEAEKDLLLKLEPALQLRRYRTVEPPVLQPSGGQLLAQSLICWLGVWLVWQTADGQIKRCWLFRDAFSESGFRTLARTLCQLRWQQQQLQAASELRGLFQWLR
jgi:hypothetical protein